MNVAAAALASLLLTLPASVQTRRLLIGRSVEGRRIEAVELGDPHSHYKLLVVGCIHGNEFAGLAIVTDNTKWRFAGLLKLADGLEPSTPSLP